MQTLKIALVAPIPAAIQAASSASSANAETQPGTDAGSLSETSQTPLENWLLAYASDYQNEGYPYKRFLSDLITHGCGSGIISTLIYTHECIDFYTRFEDDIWDIVTEYLDSTGDTFGQFMDSFRDLEADCPGTFKTMLSWFAVEQTADQLLQRIDSHD